MPSRVSAHSCVAPSATFTTPSSREARRRGRGRLRAERGWRRRRRRREQRRARRRARVAPTARSSSLQFRRAGPGGRRRGAVWRAARCMPIRGRWRRRVCRGTGDGGHGRVSRGTSPTSFRFCYGNLWRRPRRRLPGLPVDAREPVPRVVRRWWAERHLEDPRACTPWTRAWTCHASNGRFFRAASDVADRPDDRLVIFDCVTSTIFSCSGSTRQ